jgi:hypothetical protein
VPIVVRQLVFPRPSCNLFGLTVGPAAAILLASVALVEESLILALQLVVEYDAPDPAATIPQSFLGALVGAIDLGVVGQFAWLPEAGPERLTGLVRAVVAFVSVGFEEISPTVRQDTGAVLRTDWRRT